MAFLRIRRSGDRSYVYLVGSEWDPHRGPPRQRVLRCLGRPDRLDPGRIPARLRDPTLLRKLPALRQHGQALRRATVRGIRQAFLGAIRAGSEERAERLAGAARRLVGVDRLPEELFRPALRGIGARGREGRIPVRPEHVATGIVARVLERANARLADPGPSAPLVVLCVPDSEEHALPLLFAEGLLRRRGFRTLNTGGGAPAAETARYVGGLDPVAVLISVTQPQGLGAHELRPSRRAPDAPAYGS